MAQDNILRRLFSGANGFMVAALAAATIVLVSAAVIGARDLSDDGATASQVTDDRSGETTDGETTTDFDDLSDDGTSDSDDPGTTGAEGESADQTGSGGSDGTSGEGSGSGGGEPGDGGPGGGDTGNGGGGSPAGGPLDEGPRQGVHADHFEWGVHAPVTLNGAPLNIAEDFLIGVKGYVTHLNRAGGVNGRKVRLFITDDKYTTSGGREARDALVGDVKPFLIAGTLGVDQIHVVAKGAKAAGIPYIGGGGPGPEWGPDGEDIGMYQVLSSYDQYMDLLVDYICRYGKDYVGENDIRLGTTTLDSPYILPVEERFVDALEERGCVVTPVDDQARGTIQKPDEQTEYSTQLTNLASAYGGQGANLIVPLQDPISTSRQVQQLRTYANYNPHWTFNNFVHDADTTLALMGGEWTGTRGLSGACYYLSENAYNPDLCKKMHVAHDQWVELGHVEYDQNGGGCGGGNCEYTYDEGSWQEDGQGGSAGYQLVHFWLGAMKQIGPDPTRDKFHAAVRDYENYDDLITMPISFKGSSNRMVGAYGGVVYEGQSNLKYRQVNQITPGLVDQF